MSAPRTAFGGATISATVNHPARRLRGRPRGTWRGAGIVLALAVTAGCGNEAEQQAMPEAPPPSVLAVAAEIRPVGDEAQFVGRVTAVNRVELRARVEGYLKERHFTEGQEVAVGDLLFTIEPDRYEAVVRQREADLEKARADEQNASAQLLRREELSQKDFVSKSEVDELRAAKAIATAGISQAEAALAAAQLDLDYTRISAPITGRIGLASFNVGNLVGPSSGALATIVSGDPIYVHFPLSHRELLNARRDIEESGGTPNEVVVDARLADGALYKHEGRIDFVDVTTDPGTDTVTVRAEFPNPDGILVDGQYVGVVVRESEPQESVVVPQSALQVDQQGIYILIVDAEQKAQVRRIEIGQQLANQAVVTSGLEAGELVISQGIQKVRPGMPVTVTPEGEAGGGAAQ